MRQRNPRKEWLESSAYQSIKKIVNTVCLEQFSEDDSGATITNHEPASPKRIRMERHIRLLREKNEQQKTVILPARAHTCLNNIENAFESVEFPAQISTPRSSTSALIRSNEITPQERKRRIKMKGERFFKSLKVVADAHHGNIYEVIGNLASEGDLSYSDMIVMGQRTSCFRDSARRRH